MENFKLIDGNNYSAEDAKEILLAVIDDKIKFHKNKIFSHEERFGKQHEHSEIRIKELQTSKEDVMKLIEEHLATDASFEIYATVHITKK